MKVLHVDSGTKRFFRGVGNTMKRIGTTIGKQVIDKGLQAAVVAGNQAGNAWSREAGVPINPFHEGYKFGHNVIGAGIVRAMGRVPEKNVS